MASNPSIPDFIWELFNDLRRRKFPLGVDDLTALRSSLQLGFGWSSQSDLVELCCTLWAKSNRDADIIRALYAQYNVPEWNFEVPNAGSKSESQAAESTITEGSQPNVHHPAIIIEKTEGLPPISLDDIEFPASHLTFVPRFPLTYREVAQAWRRLRKPSRFGPRTEIDLEATLTHAMRVGMLTGPILIPPKRNSSKLLLLIDSMGSMTPFHSFVREIVLAMTTANNFGRVGQFYFHDILSEGYTPQEFASDGLFPSLERLVEQSTPITTGFIYSDEMLTQPYSIKEVYEHYAIQAHVVVVSDAGAARQNLDFQRVVDTVASLKFLRSFSRHIIWFNPLPKASWLKTTAEQIARYIPMFPLDTDSLGRAVDTLKAGRYIFEGNE